MGFLDNIGNWAEKSVKDFGNDIGWATAMNDLATVTTNDKNWAGDAFQLLGDTFKATTAAATYIPRKVGGAIINKAVLPVFEASYKAGGAVVREPLSAAITGLATGNFKEAYNQRKEISAGQAIAYMQSRFDPTASELRGDFNIFDANDREIFDTNWRYRTISGAYDTFFTTVTDPLGKIGKAFGLARKALVTQPMGAVDANAASLTKDFFLPKAIRGVTIISPQTLATKINEGRDIQGGLNSTLEWMAANNSKTIRNHPMIAASNDADTMSYLLGEANTVDDVADTLLAVSSKDTEAMARLVDKRKDLAFVMDKLKPVSELDKQIIDNIPTNGIVTDPNILDAADALVKLADEDPYIQYLTRLNLKGADLTKRTFGASMAQKGAIREAERKTARSLGEQPSPTAYPTIGLFQPTKYHPLVAVVNFAERWSGERPAGWFNSNDSDSFNEIKAFGGMLRKIVGGNLSDATVAEHYDLFIKAGDNPAARGVVAESFENLAIMQINKSLGISDETAATIWNAYKGRRKVALDSIRDRKYLMTNDNVILKIPYAERQGVNAKPMVDLENYARVLTENKGLIQAIEGNQGIIDPDVNRYVLGLLNDVWKASVLLRLGYTVRNTAEATMSILAKGYGLVAAADINKESLSNWYDNRIVGLDRLIDKNLVKKGYREDSVAVRNEMASLQRERAQLQSMNQEIDSQMESIELAFKEGKLTEEQALEFLEISSYRTGEILHHGSQKGLTDLNPNRALAMTYSNDIANRYAEAGMKIISAARIQERLTGRAGRLPRNIERSPADEIGSQAVVERISDEAFTELNSYVNGDFGDVQAGLRDPSFATSRGRNVPELPKGLQRTIQRSVLTKPLTVYRGTTNPKSPFINAQVGDIIEEPAFVSTSYSDNVARNFATPSPIEKVDVLNLQPGGPMTLPGSISTQIEMKLPKGLNGLDIAETYAQFKNLGYANLQRESIQMVYRESEVLLPAGTKFRVISRGGDAENGYAITVQAILPKKAPQVPASKGLQTVAADMRDGFRNSVAKGNRVELLNPQTGSWRSIDPETISQKLLVEGQFRIAKPGNQGQVVTSKVYGEQVDLRTFSGSRVRLGLNDYPELRALGLDVRKPDSWKGKEKQLLNWMRKNNVGKLTLPDTKANGRATVLVDPKMVETGDQNPAANLARKRLNEIRQEQIDGLDAQEYSQSTRELADIIAKGKYPASGVINLVRELADRNSIAKAKHENFMQRLDARVVEEKRLTDPKKRIGTGMYRQKLYDGTVIEHPDAMAGEPGDILGQRTDNADTYKLFADAPSQLFSARYGGMEELRLSSNDPRYFTGYANYLNNFWRSPNENKIDPIIEKFLDNETPEQVVTWLRTTDEGKAYSTTMSIDNRGFKVADESLNVGTDANEFVGNLYSAYARYLPDAEIQEAFRNNLIDEMYLRRHFADQPAMPDIIGSVIPQAPGVAGVPGAAQAFVQKAFYFLGSLPETTFARHPLARAVYRAEMRQRADIALSLKRSQLEDSKAELTLDEINALRKDAVEGARREVNKTLFTIMRKSYAGEKMRYLMPFFNAWENTMRRWSTLAKDNPAAIARAGQITSSLSNQNNYVDKDGNPSSDFSYDSKLVLPMPETFMKTMEAVPGGKGLAAAIRSAGSQVSIPIRSLDVMFQGEVHPGFGPVVAIPAQYLEIMRPDLEGILKQVIPYGAADSPMKTLLPPALQKAAQLWSVTRDGSWSRTFNTVYRYELIKYRLGERETEPTFQEINDLTNNMYKVKALSNLVLPFAAQYDSPLGWYTQQYRKLQQTYGAQADALFLQMYPEMGEATISASLNNTGVDATQTAVANLKKYDGLISKIGTTTPEMIGFLVNDPDGKYDFSQAAYQWQMRNSPVPGSTTNFRGQRDPALLKQDAQKKMGWIDYRKAMDYLDQQLFAQGYTSYSQSGAEELNLLKQAFTRELATTNKDWAADFYSVDKGKWIYRMQTISTILRDPQWMQDNGNRPVVGAIATYYVTRTQIARELANRRASGASGTLTAADNADLEGLWNQTIATLKQESLEFSSFYNRFLQNDPVTLG